MISRVSIFVRGILLILMLSAVTGLNLAQESDGDEILHIVVSATEGAEVNRSNWQAGVFEALLPGMTVDSISPIRTGDAGEVVILCSNLQTYETLFDTTDTACSPDIPDAKISTGGVEVGTRGISKPLTIISPFRYPASFTRNRRPVFEWTAHPLANSYSLTLYLGAEQVWLVENITETRVAYPQELPELMATDENTTYSLVITAYEGVGENKQILMDQNRVVEVAMNFKIMDNTTFESINVILQQIANLADLNPTERAFVQFRYLVEVQLYEEALQQLNVIAPIDDKAGDDVLSYSPIPYLSMGELYLRGDIPVMAQLAFSRALRLARAMNHAEAIAMAYVGLSKTAADPNAGYCYLGEALGFYERVGDTGNMSALQTEQQRILASLQGIIPLCDEVLAQDA